MARIQPVNHLPADSATRDLRASMEKKLDAFSNMIASMASPPAVANACIGFGHDLSAGTLPPLQVYKQGAMDARRGTVPDDKKHTALEVPARLSSVAGRPPTLTRCSYGRGNILTAKSWHISL